MPKSPKWKEPKKHRVLASLNALEREFGWPIDTLKSWSRKNLIKPTPAGNWSSRAVWKVYENRKKIQDEARKARQVETSEKGKSNLETKRFFDAVVRSIDAKERLEEVVTVESVRSSFMEVSDIVRSNLQSASNRLSLKLANKNQRQVQEILQAELVGIADKVQEQVDQLELERPGIEELFEGDD